MDRLTSIVVGVDFSSSSAFALAQAMRIAAWNRAALHAIHVVETLVVVEMEEALSPLVKGIQDSLVEDAKKKWRDFANDVPGKGDVEFSVAVNNQVAELLARVKVRAADLLVLGAKGHSREEGVGPIAAQLLRRSSSKVLLVREGHPGPFKRVVACVDFSETSRIALEAAVRIVAQDGGKLSVVHVFRPPWNQFPYRVPAVAADAAFQSNFRAGMHRRLEEFCQPKSPETTWVKPTYHLLEDPSYGAALIEFTARSGADLVVLGTRGRSNLRDVLIGTTAERIVRGAPCSILAVKPEA